MEIVDIILFVSGLLILTLILFTSLKMFEYIHSKPKLRKRFSYSINPPSGLMIKYPHFIFTSEDFDDKKLRYYKKIIWNLFFAFIIYWLIIIMVLSIFKS